MVKQFLLGGGKVEFFKEVELFGMVLNCFWRDGIGIFSGSSRGYFKRVEKFSEGIKDFWRD